MRRAAGGAKGGERKKEKKRNEGDGYKLRWVLFPGFPKKVSLWIQAKEINEKQTKERKKGQAFFVYLFVFTFSHTTPLSTPQHQTPLTDRHFHNPYDVLLICLFVCLFWEEGKGREGGGVLLITNKEWELTKTPQTNQRQPASQQETGNQKGGPYKDGEGRKERASVGVEERGKKKGWGIGKNEIFP